MWHCSLAVAENDCWSLRLFLTWLNQLAHDSVEVMAPHSLFGHIHHEGSYGLEPISIQKDATATEDRRICKTRISHDDLPKAPTPDWPCATVSGANVQKGPAAWIAWIIFNQKWVVVSCVQKNSKKHSKAPFRVQSTRNH